MIHENQWRRRSRVQEWGYYEEDKEFYLHISGTELLVVAVFCKSWILGLVNLSI